MKHLLLSCLILCATIFTNINPIVAHNNNCISDSWTKTDSTLTPARRNSAIVVKDDCEILLFGGLNGAVPAIIPNITSLDTSENNGQWKHVANVADDMNGPWFPTTKGAFFMGNDNENIYVTCEDAADGKIWKFNTNTNVFSTINENNRMPYPSEDCCAFGINDNIYIFGGQKFGVSYDTTQIYNIVSDTWTLGASMQVSREDFGCAMIDNSNEIYLFGGVTDGTVVLDSIEKYSVSDNSWQFFENGLEYPRRSMAAQHIPNTNEILLIGGDACYDQGEGCSSDDYVNNVDVFNIDTNEIDSLLSSQYPDLVEARGGVMVAIIDNNKCNNDLGDSLSIYAIGGEYILDETPWNGVETLCYHLSDSDSSDSKSSSSSSSSSV